MKTSEQINELAAALAKAAAEFPVIQRRCKAKMRGKEGRQGREYWYADLDDVLSAVRGPLAKNGLTLSHDCRVSDQPFVAFITARLEHSSGQWKESEPMPMPCEGFMSAAQQIGSANTYGKRYTAQNILGISTETDDDGAAAGGGDDMETSERDALPACPKCNKSDSVIEDKFKGGFKCWEKRGGCGNHWLPADEQPEQPKANGKAADVAAEHGLKTGADIAAAQKKTFDLALKEIAKCVRERDMAYLKVVSGGIKQRASEGKLSKEQDTNLCNELAMAEKKIEELLSEPLPA